MCLCPVVIVHAQLDEPILARVHDVVVVADTMTEQTVRVYFTLQDVLGITYAEPVPSRATLFNDGLAESSVRPADAPPRLTVLIDASDEAVALEDNIRVRTAEFLRALPENAIVEVYQYNIEVIQLLYDSTDGDAAAEAVVMGYNPVEGGSACLYDALYRRMEAMNPAERDAIIVIAVAGDNSSASLCDETSAESVIERSQAIGVPVYAGLLVTTTDHTETITLASETRGIVYFDSVENLQTTLANLNAALENQFVAEFAFCGEANRNSATFEVEAGDAVFLDFVIIDFQYDCMPTVGRAPTLLETSIGEDTPTPTDTASPTRTATQSELDALYLTATALEAAIIEATGPAFSVRDATATPETTTEPISPITDTDANATPDQPSFPLITIIVIGIAVLVPLGIFLLSRGRKSGADEPQQAYTPPVNPPAPTAAAAPDTIQVFISYRRVSSGTLPLLVAEKLERQGFDVFVDVNRSDSAGPFPERLLREVEKRHVFICLLADDTLDSDWVMREIRHAVSLGKPMIPVFQEEWTVTTSDDPAVLHMLQYQGVHILNRKMLFIDAAIEQLSKLIRSSITN
jgi:hypothetical protein